MAEGAITGRPSGLEIIQVSHPSDVHAAREAAKSLSAAIGFDPQSMEQIVLAVSELASNLLKHARGGTLGLTCVENGGRSGIAIESLDEGPGIPDVDLALADGFSTAGSLGYGLGSINRLMDELEITSRSSSGTRILCTRWVRLHLRSTAPCPLTLGAATQAHPQMAVNGDAFVIKQWGEKALVGVIDGLGHGQFAHRAAQAARQYVESHYDQPLDGIFSGVARGCRATRGVVMALARFDWGQARLACASIGDVEVRVFGGAKINLVVRRGVLGLNPPRPVVTEHPWDPGQVMVLHSDGVTSRWRWQDFPHLADVSATIAARALLRALARTTDDATVVVVKSAEQPMRSEGKHINQECRLSPAAQEKQ